MNFVCDGSITALYLCFDKINFALNYVYIANGSCIH